MTISIINLEDGQAIKRCLDDAVVECLQKRGYKEDLQINYIKMVLHTIMCSCAITAQFYPLPYPKNVNILIICAIVYYIGQTIVYFIQKTGRDEHLFLSKGSSKERGIKVMTTMAKYSYDFEFSISERDAPSAANVQKQSVGKYFDWDGRFEKQAFLDDVNLWVDQLHEKKNK